MRTLKLMWLTVATFLPINEPFKTQTYCLVKHFYRLEQLKVKQRMLVITSLVSVATSDVCYIIPISDSYDVKFIR